MLDIEKILKQCGVGDSDYRDVLVALAKLNEELPVSDVIEVYNYIILNNNDIKLLQGVVKLADNYRHVSTLPILTDLLLKNCAEDNDDIINLRVLCIKAISNYKDNSTLGTLLYCLNNKKENYRVRLACADAMGRIGDKYAVAPLISILEDDEEQSIYVKESATFALGLLGDLSAIDPLVEIMETKQGIWDKFSFLKEKIIEALGKLNSDSKKVLKVLRTSLMDSSAMVRINAIEALMNSDYEEAPELIRKALHDEDAEVQRNALIALYNLQGRDILDEVISLPSYSEELKQEAKDMIEEYEEN